MSKVDSWPIDGPSHHDISTAALYVDSKISRFLEYDSSTLLVAAKGMGKTLLLRVKKNKLENGPDGTLIIPREAEYDEPQLFGTFPKTGLDDVSFWEDLWKCSIILSIVSHFWKSHGDESEQNTMTALVGEFDIDKEFKDALLNDFCVLACNNPSYYLAKILNRSVGAIRKFLKSSYRVNVISDKYISSSVAVFIDGFDQTMTKHFSGDLEIWKNAQLGLAKSVHKLNTHNRHIKVYASIRQEAYSGFADDDREVIKGNSVLLEYTYRDLKKMLNHSIKRYTKYKDISEFCHLSEISNGWCKKNEDIFSYIYRHSIATPRSIMFCGSQLNDMDFDDCDKADIEYSLRRVINKVGGDNVYKDYFLGQKTIFLQTLNSEEKIKDFFSLIPANILHGKAMASINRRFAKKNSINVASSHPFCELYNIGLLGVVKRDAETNTMIQYFKKSYEFSWEKNELVKSESDIIYLIHPSLHGSITTAHNKIKYCLNPVSIIGDERSWDVGDKDNVFPLLFISYSIFDQELIKRIIPILEDSINCVMPSNIWYDKWSLKAGDNIYQEVEKGVSGSNFVLIFVSKSSLESTWVKTEWQKKHSAEISENRIQVIAIIIDDTDVEQLPDFLKTKKAIIISCVSDEMIRYDLEKLCLDISDHICAERDKSFCCNH